MKISQFDAEFELKRNNIRNNVRVIRDRIDKAAIGVGKRLEDINFMAVTKKVPAFYVNVAIEEGINLLGESLAQELNAKYCCYKKDGVSIHFIGHLQSRKVKSVINIVDVIESVDSVKLANVIGKEAEKVGKEVSIFLEVNVGDEISKFGFSKQEIYKAVVEISNIKNIKIKGLMAIPPIYNTNYYFEQMQSIYIDISNKKIDNVDMKFLSMGMSDDFEKAIFFGANIVRIGSSLFNCR